ncbi:MAG: hypothetical protein KJ069_07125 [Anaerolineae bacterium]|nr:hypothetical protein [Anaerolineae bacterium]
MEIVENLTQWSDEFEKNWLKHYQETGETLWKIYNRARNETAPGLPGIDLSQSRLLFISTAGGYVAGEQQPFAAADLLGDYTVRTFPVDTPLAQLAYAHDHYDHTAVTTDPQVLLPLNHLQEMVAAGEIGSLYPEVISFHGYQPDVRRIVNELIPTVLGMVDKGKIDGALLVPA